MTSTPRRFLAAAAVLAAGAAAVALLRPAPVSVEAAPADRGPVRVTVDWTGKTRVRQRYLVAAPVSGELQRVVLEAGDRVTAGTVLARLGGAAPTPQDARSRAELAARLAAAGAAVAEGEAGLARAGVAEAQAARDAARAEALGAQGVQPVQAAEAAQAEARVRAAERRMAEGALARARAEEAAARAALADGGPGAAPVEVRAPTAGLVLRVVRQSAGPVAAGTPLLELGDPADLEIVLDLPTADAVRVRPGQAALVTGWGDAVLQAVVRRIEPSAYTKVSPLGVEEQRVDVRLDPRGEGWGGPARAGPGDGFAVDVQVVVAEEPEALRVPSSALLRQGDGWALFAAEGGRARRRAVEVLARGNGWAALRAGVRPGELVLLHPAEEIADGARVSVR